MKLLRINLLDVLKKDKLFFKDAFLNTIAFAIYIFSQQIILLPILAKILGEGDYANVILFISILNIFCNVLGGQLGITHQLQKASYEGNEDGEGNDFLILMSVASLLIIILLPIILIYLKLDVFSIVILTITAVISNYRQYIRYYFRIHSSYKKTIIQNICYLIGICIGIIIIKYLKLMWIPLFLGEALALGYTVMVTPNKRNFFHKSIRFEATIKRYAGLGITDVLINAITLVDKILIYPLLGAYSLAVYNAGTATSKVSSLVMNPLNEVILVKLSKAKDRGSSNLIKAVINISLIFSVLLFIILIPLIYGLSYFLYRQYLNDICNIIFLLSLGCAISTASSVMKSFIFRYAKPEQLTICYLLNLIFLMFFGCLGANMFGLFGFALSVVLGRLELLISFIFVLFRYCYSEEY